jgi:diaminopimelate decarboxylase
MNFENLAQKYGTPYYVYELSIIERQIQTFQSAFSNSKLRIKYAMKALSNLTILKFMKSKGVEIDAVSLEEIQLALLAGYKAEQILFTPNCVGFETIKKAVEIGVQINIDDLTVLAEFGECYQGNVPCCIRINPHILAGGNEKISTGHIDSKFGVSIHQLDQILDLTKKYQIKVNGVHVHTGSDILDSDVFLLTAKVVFDVAKNFPDLEFLDFGSGFKVAYKENDIVTDLKELGESLEKEFQSFCKEYGKELELWFEPGKFLVSESGSLITKVATIKTTPTNKFVGVDSGLNHLIRPMMYDSYHEIVNVSNNGAPKKLYSVVGQICETDTLGKLRSLNMVRKGDLLRIKNCGAYGFSMASNYNSRTRPPEIAVYNNQDYLIRKREDFEDLTRMQCETEIKF